MYPNIRKPLEILGNSKFPHPNFRPNSIRKIRIRIIRTHSDEFSDEQTLEYQAIRIIRTHKKYKTKIVRGGDLKMHDFTHALILALLNSIPTAV